jgi:arylsulfatase A-like enzyme
MLFTRAYAASPLCSPTRASLLTGQNPARIGITAPVCHEPVVRMEASVRQTAPAKSKVLGCESATRLDAKYVTLAETLKKAGYATAHFGKWHLGSEPYSPLEQGFDVDLPHTAGPGPAGSFVAPWKFKDFKERTPAEHIEDRMGDEAVAWMENHKDGPFFLNYWQFSVHAPFDAKKALIEKHRARVNPEDPQRSPTYAAMVESMDDNVGKLLDALDRLGIADRTAVVFFSDNGGNMYSRVDGTVPTSNAPLRGGKATLYEGGLRVPCVVSWPQVTKPGSRSDAVIQSTDFYQTFLQLLRLQPEPGQVFDGISIVPALRGEALNREAIFSIFPHSPGVPDTLPPGVTATAGDWKLIRLFHEGENGAHAYRLYNLKDDIGETRDLAAEQPERVRQLDGLITKFLAETKAVVPLPNPAFGRDTAEPATAATDPLQSWKARGCDAVVKEGIVTVSGSTERPFLGVGAGKLAGPAKVKFRARSTAGGAGKVEWLPTPAAADKARSVEFQLTGSEWQEVSVDLPAQGPLGIMRLYLPAQKEPVQIDWVEVTPAEGSARRWDF